MAVEGIIYRLVKAAPLTAAEMDGNLEALANAFAALEGLFAVSLNPDGTLKVNTVSTDAIQDRAVTQRKLAFLSPFYAVSGGAANAYTVSFTPALGAYAAGLVFFVNIHAANTGVSTLNVDGLGAVTIKKNASEDLAAGDLAVNGVYIFVHDGTNFQLIGKIAAVTTPVLSEQNTPGLTALPAGPAMATLTIAHGLTGMPKVVQVVLYCQTSELGYTAGDEVPISHLINEIGGGSGPPPVRWDATNVYVTIYSDSLLLPRPDVDDTGSQITRGNWRVKVYAFR